MEPISFEELAKLSVLKKFYGVAQKIFGVTIALLKPDSRDGVLLGPAEGLNPFCQLLGSDPQGRKICVNCDFLHQQEAKQLKKSIQYTCHAGLIDFVIPIFYGKTIIAYLQCGQVLDKKPSRKGWERIKTVFQGLNIDMGRLRQHYFKTRVIPRETRQGLVELLEIFANYIADAGSRLLMLEKDRKSQIVFLAESHIKRHVHEQIALDAVAKESYTSKRNLTRVFLAETGMTVLKYINTMKVERACDLLAATTGAISASAFECGFGSIQQFNRVFRQVTGTTPRLWRKKK